MLNQTLMSDAQVREDVLRELRLDSRLEGAKINVAVSDGSVTLTGTLGSTTETLLAVEAARRAEGVFDVVNDLKIGAPDGRTRTDADIAGAVRQAFEWDSLIPHHRIQVAVSNSWVALHGSVDLLRERESAERLARRMEGVRGVYNLIEVAPPEASAENVREAIGAALRHHAERKAAGIEVSLRDGTASLAGKVHTWAEKQAILGALWNAPGVERVNDQLSIDPYF